MNTLPLITGHTLDDCLAWRPDGPVSVREFIADARMLAARLPAGDWLLNVCQDRYRFAVGFAAGLPLLALPPNAALLALAVLALLLAGYLLLK